MGYSGGKFGFYLSLDLLSKTVATVLHDAKMSTRDIADLLGHSDISTTEQCYIISTEVEKKRKKWQ